jgi:diguanylate cyclase (GGDEF)-like protein/PAS domain S-box-containing protein
VTDPREPSVFEDSELRRSILETLPTGLCVIDMQKKIVFWSDGAERITGRSRHEVIGHSCLAEPLLYCDQPDCELCTEQCPLALTIKSARPTDSIGFLHHKAGHEIPVRARALPVRNARGLIVGAVTLFEDAHETASADPDEERSRLPGCVDEITGAAGQIMMQSYLREALGSFTHMQIPFGVLCFRLEQFGHFRASFGPEAASTLLRVIARTLEGGLWRTDFFGRWSDDQFLVILNGCREDALYSVRERIRRMLANDAIEWWGERRSLPLSIGHATAQPGDTVESLMQRAQQSLNATSMGKPLAAATMTNPFTRS